MEGNNLSQLLKIGRRLLTLKYENAKIVAAQKITLLLENFMLMIICVLFGACIMLFFALAAAHFLSEVMETGWAYLIVAGFYILVLALVMIFKRRLIGNVISRFVTRLIFDLSKND